MLSINSLDCIFIREIKVEVGRPNALLEMELNNSILVSLKGLADGLCQVGRMERIWK